MMLRMLGNPSKYSQVVIRVISHCIHNEEDICWGTRLRYRELQYRKASC
jgi:hypothetical protein